MRRKSKWSWSDPIRARYRGDNPSVRGAGFTLRGTPTSVSRRVSVQRTDNIDFEFQYQYHTGWGLRQVTYPSGRQIYYAPQGALKQVTLGNALTERWSFSAQRQQPYDVRLGTAGNEMSHLTLQFAYCANNYAGGSCATNNGSVMGQSIGISVVRAANGHHSGDSCHNGYGGQTDGFVSWKMRD